MDNTKPDRTHVAVMVARDFASRLRVIAGHRRMTMAEALEAMARPTLDKEYRAVVLEVERGGTAGA